MGYTLHQMLTSVTINFFIHSLVLCDDCYDLLEFIMDSGYL